VSFFDRVEASPEKYRDIVSIFVDRETYSQTEDDVKKYANNIETYLG